MRRFVKVEVLIILAIILSSGSLVSWKLVNSGVRFDDGSRETKVIASLLGQGYRFVLPRDYFNGDNLGKVALLLHDGDYNNNGMAKFIQVETGFGVKSCFLPRPDSEWFSAAIIDYKNVEARGWEVGYQYDCLSRVNGSVVLAAQMFRGQLSYMRALFNVSTTDYHGDYVNPTVFNLNLYNETLWHSLGLSEIYSLKNCSYFSDTDNVLHSPGLPLKDLVMVQLHTDWTK